MATSSSNDSPQTPHTNSSDHLFDISTIHCRSAPDFLALGDNEPVRGSFSDVGGFRLEEIKSNDCLSIPPTPNDRSHTPPPQPQYSKMSEKLRQIGSSSPKVHRFQCGTFCGGKGCKYENPSRWGKNKGVAFDGLFSHWVTDSIIAMARPSTLLFTEYHLLTQFKEAGVNAVINLQTPGEHAHCGPGQESSGFTYKPEYLMKNDIYFYNFHWPDYGTSSVDNILDVVKVIDFSVSDGKVAIHCHAGLGRTGVAIACYLIYSERISTEEAITRVRDKRPNSIQTRGQLELINEFWLHLLSLWTLYPCFPSSLTLHQYMERQSNLLHGEELEQHKHIPKVIKVLCNRLKELADNESFNYQWCNEVPDDRGDGKNDDDDDGSSWLVVSYVSSLWKTPHLKTDFSCNEKEDHMIQSLLGTSPCSKSDGCQKRLSALKDEINNQWIWKGLNEECDPTVLFSMLFTFLSHLKVNGQQEEPVISLADCYQPNVIEQLSKKQKAIIMMILETVKTVVPLPDLISFFSAITIHLIMFLCHCSSDLIEDNSTATNHLLHYIMDYFQ